MEINTLLIAAFIDEIKTKKKFLKAIPEDSFAYILNDKSKKFGELINHMSSIPSWVSAITRNSELDWSQVTPPAVINSKEVVIKQYESNYAIEIKALEDTNNQELMKKWTMSHSDTLMYSGTKHTAIRRYVL